MFKSLADYRVFWGEFRRTFHSTGAVMPSGRSLCRALSRQVRSGSGGRRILEVGPGTGAVTKAIVASLQPGDTLDLVELNERFVAHLRERFEQDNAFSPAADRTRILHQNVQELPQQPTYDIIISGLPLNNFAVEVVESILETLERVAKPGATLSFFEYVAIRPLRGMISRGGERARLRGIGKAIHQIRDGRQIGRDLVWPNVPPAWVHHVRLEAGGSRQ